MYKSELELRMSASEVLKRDHYFESISACVPSVKLGALTKTYTYNEEN